ncbi:MAG: ABC transporter ATP-binding protein, partial [Rhodoferax sp.]|nr:ABC transporter ATP-binding protein [Rhodoferax sp.]
MSDAPLLQIRDLSVGFASRAGSMLSVLRNIDFRVFRGETVGLVGESGSGKSTLALAAMAYLKPGLQVTGGSVHLSDIDLLALDRQGIEALRGGRIALVPQNAGQALTPTLRIGRQIIEALALHSWRPVQEHPGRMLQLLAQVRLPQPELIAQRYPHELSGGQQQRVAIAMALAGEPEVLLLDEPTTGLDVTTQAHILDLLRSINRQTGTAMVYVSHDLGAIARVCERVVVLYAGEVVLEGSTRHVLLDPAHPYARGLLASIPRLSRQGLPAALAGRPPAPGAVQAGCAFADRCELVETDCRSRRPELVPVPGAALSRCHRAAESRRIPLDGLQDRPAQSGEPGVARALRLDAVSLSYARPTLFEQLLGRPPSVPATVDRVALE